MSNTVTATQQWCRGLVYHKFMVVALLIFRVFTCAILRYFIKLLYDTDILIILITTHTFDSHGYFANETTFLWHNFLLKIRVRQKGNTGQFVATVHSGSQEEGGSVFQGQGAFNNYVVPILPTFDHLPPPMEN